MCTFLILDVVKERPQSANGHVNGLSPEKKKAKQSSETDLSVLNGASSSLCSLVYLQRTRKPGKDCSQTDTIHYEALF